MSKFSLFNLWDFDLDGRFYESLGIRWFKRYSTQGDFWNKRRRISAPRFKNVKDLNSAIEWESHSRFNDILHLCRLAVGLTIMAWLYLKNEYVWMITIAFVVTIWDIYPIMLQHYNRARIWRIKSLMRRIQKI